MFLSTLCVIGVMILGYVGTVPVRQHACHECIPYIYCNNAKKLAETDHSENAIQLFRDAFCDIINGTMVTVCCRKFDVPSLNTRWNLEPRYPTTELLRNTKSPLNTELQRNTESLPNTELLPNTCGSIAINRIFGGEVADIYEFPWMVLIAYGDNAAFGCAGTLINNRYVLTAAHCVLNKDIKKIRVGDYDLTKVIDCVGNICEKKIQEREVEIDIVHESYEWNTYTNDIALLRLKYPVDLPLKNVNAICLPITTEMQQESIENKQATVAGWGLSERGKLFTDLRKVVIPIHSSTVCEDYYSHMSGSDIKQFCAGVPGKDSCKGDSGGPLMIDSVDNGKSKSVLYGIVSNGPEKCGNSPGIYTDVRKYINWILNNIEP